MLLKKIRSAHIRYCNPMRYHIMGTHLADILDNDDNVERDAVIHDWRQKYTDIFVEDLIKHAHEEKRVRDLIRKSFQRLHDKH